MKYHTQVLIKLWPFHSGAAIAGMLLAALAAGCNSSSTPNSEAVESLTASTETDTGGVGGSSDDPSAIGGTDTGDEDFRMKC